MPMKLKQLFPLLYLVVVCSFVFVFFWVGESGRENIAVLETISINFVVLFYYFVVRHEFKELEQHFGVIEGKIARHLSNLNKFE